MASPEALKSFLEQKKIRYEVLKHPEAFTAQEVAHAIHKTGKVLAKTVVVDADGKNVMVVVPAHHKVQLDAVRKLTGSKEIRLSPEENLRGLFPDCDLGAMPPIGLLYNMKVVVSKELSERPEIIFNACTHTDCVKMAFSDFQQLVGATLAEVSA
jgi:Ala-tRNA(Pro) deacylase